MTNNTPESPPSVEHTDKHTSPALLVFLAIPVLGILVALLMVANEGNRTSNALPSNMNPNTASLVNFVAPQFELERLEGGIVKLEDYRGKVLFLNFWQTTCEPCKREMPAFVDFLEDNGSDVALLAINFDESADQINAFLQENGIDGIPIALDSNSAVRRSYGIANIPVTFIIDVNGVVRNMRLGEMRVEAMQAEYEAAKALSSSAN